MKCGIKIISKRLKSLTKYVSKEDKIIDIGCDHAYLDIYLVSNNFIDSMIVSDIHRMALEIGITNINKNNLSDKIDARLGDGLNVLTDKDKINTILISGMGTSTIIKILDSKYLNNINKLIIQSNNNHFELRSKICDMGFIIKDEEYFIDNKKNYINIVFVRGKKSYKKYELKYGPILIKDENYLKFELSNIEKIKKLIPEMKLIYRYKLNKEYKFLNKLLKGCSK